MYYFLYILRVTPVTYRFNFKPVDLVHRSLVHKWIAKPHVTKWFYGQGLQNTLTHLDEFLNGTSQCDYWLAFDKEHPFAFLITSSVENPHDELTKWCTTDGDAITLDMLIGDLNYLGKGLAVPLIQEFLKSQFPKVTEVLIDPEATNSCAIHVYQKAGFKILAEFIPSHSPHPHYMMRLNLKELLSKSVTIRPMTASDIKTLVQNFCFSWSSIEETTTNWNQYYQEQKKNIRTVAILEKNSQILEYGNLLRHSEYPYFIKFPEINNVWIDQEHQRRGLGTQLITWLEELARREGYKQIGIGVGLYRDYGPAQKFYFQLGYIPDGHGITYKCKPVKPGKSYLVDDDLILWLIKPL